MKDTSNTIIPCIAHATVFQKAHVGVTCNSEIIIPVALAIMLVGRNQAVM